MATAKLVLPDGTTVSIEGTADEVATLLTRFSGDRPSKSHTSGDLPKHRSSRSTNRASQNRQTRKGPRILLQDLADENFFRSRRTIGEVQKKLEEKGHIYGLNSLSTPLLRLTRAKVLRRIKEKSGWVYVS